MFDAYDVSLSTNAKRDLFEIVDYIGADSPAAAERWMEEVLARLASLETMPTRHPQIPESQITGMDWRQTLHGSYRIVFRVEGRHVRVIRVIHGARHWPGGYPPPVSGE